MAVGILPALEVVLPELPATGTVASACAGAGAGVIAADAAGAPTSAGHLQEDWHLLQLPCCGDNNAVDMIAGGHKAILFVFRGHKDLALSRCSVEHPRWLYL